MRALDEARPDAVVRPATVHRDEEKVAVRRDVRERARVALDAKAVVELRVLGVYEPLGVGGDVGGAPPHQPQAGVDDSGTSGEGRAAAAARIRPGLRFRPSISRRSKKGAG